MLSTVQFLLYLLVLTVIRVSYHHLNLIILALRRYVCAFPPNCITCCRLMLQIFMHKSAMQLHAREMHRSEVKPHQCQQCLKSFSSNHQLVQHIRVHTGEKPYKCSYCDRRFKQLSHVQQHTRLHTGQSPVTAHGDRSDSAHRSQSHPCYTVLSRVTTASRAPGIHSPIPGDHSQARPRYTVLSRSTTASRAPRIHSPVPGDYSQSRPRYTVLSRMTTASRAPGIQSCPG